MRRREFMAVAVLAAIGGAAAAQSLSQPATNSAPHAAPAPSTRTAPSTSAAPSTSTAPATRTWVITTAPASGPSPGRGIEKKLEAVLPAIDWDAKPLRDAFDSFAKAANVNLVINWPSLALAGLRPDTPITFHARGLGAERTLRIIVEGISPVAGDGTRLNYAVTEDDGVSGGFVEITTMEAFARKLIVHAYPGRKLMEVTLKGASVDAAGNQKSKSQLVADLIKSELAIRGEPARARVVQYESFSGRLVVVVSPRGKWVIDGVLPILTAPVRPPAVAWRAIPLPPARETDKRLADPLPVAERERTLQEFADHFSDVGKLQVLVMPGAVDPAARKTVATPEGPGRHSLDAVANAFGVAWEIYPHGMVVFARKDQFAWHAVLGAYDVRATLKTLARDATAPAITRAAARVIKLASGVEGAADLAMIDGVLVFRAMPEAHRAFTRDFDKLVRALPAE